MDFSEKTAPFPVLVYLDCRLKGSQIDMAALFVLMADPTMADAILDRLVHNAYKIELEGDSMRKKKSPLDRKTEPVTK